MKKIILTGLIILINQIALAQVSFSKDILIEDFKVFINYLEHTHPDPYSAYGGKTEFKRQAQSLSKQISGTTTFAQFIDMLNRFTSVLEDGHTSVSRLINKETSSSNKVLPLEFKVATNGIFVYKTTNEYSYLHGSKLISVNSVPIDVFAKNASLLLPAENKYGRYRLAGFFLRRAKYAKKLVNNFPFVQLDMLLPNKEKKSIKIQYIETPQWSKKETSLKLNNENGLLYSQNIGHNSSIKYFAWHGVLSKEVIPYIKNSRTIDYLINKTYKYSTRPTIDSVAIDGIPELYPEFFKLMQSMKQENSDYLIIDLRFNDGGYTNLSRPLLYMLFGDKYLNYKSNSEYNRRLSKLLLKKHNVKTVEQLLDDNNTEYSLGEIEFGSFFKFDETSTIEEKRKDSSLISYFGSGYDITKNLNGKSIYEPHIIVLTSPITFSAAYHFLYLLNEIGNITIVGVPPGQAGNTYMGNTPFELPNTKIKGSISNAVQIFYPNNHEKGKALIPDFPMNWSDFAKYNYDENAEIMYTLDLIRKGKIK